MELNRIYRTAKTPGLAFGGMIVALSASLFFVLSACHPIQTELWVRNHQAGAFTVDVDRGYIRDTIAPNEERQFPVSRAHTVKRIVVTSVDDPTKTIIYEFPSGIVHVLFDITISQ